MWTPEHTSPCKHTMTSFPLPNDPHPIPQPTSTHTQTNAHTLTFTHKHIEWLFTVPVLHSGRSDSRKHERWSDWNQTNGQAEAPQHNTTVSFFSCHFLYFPTLCALFTFHLPKPYSRLKQCGWCPAKTLQSNKLCVFEKMEDMGTVGAYVCAWAPIC